MLKKVGSTVLGALLFATSMAQAQDHDGHSHAPGETHPVAGAQSAAAPVIPDVVARVDGEEIKADEYNQQVMMVLQSKIQQRGGGQFPSQLSPKATDEDYQLAMNALVDQKIIMVLAIKAKTIIEDAEMETIIGNIKKNFPDEAQFAAILQQQNMTIEEFKTRIRESEIAKKFIMKTLDELTKDLDTSDKALMVRYEELKEEGQLNKPALADVAHILVKADGEDEQAWADAKVKIDAARKRIVEGGEEFGAVASEVTEDPGSRETGGLYPNTRQGQMVPEFDRLTFEAPVGEVTEAFKSNFGWHIILVSKRTDAGVIPFEDVKDGIKGEMENMAKQEAYITYITDAKKDFKVEILFENAISPTENPA